PCVGPTLTFVLTLAMTSGTAVRGAILTFAYGLGLGIPFLIVALAFERSMTAFRFARRHARAFSLVGGAMLVVVGILEVTGAWSSALLWLKPPWVSSYESPLYPLTGRAFCLPVAPRRAPRRPADDRRHPGGGWRGAAGRGTLPRWAGRRRLRGLARRPPFGPDLAAWHPPGRPARRAAGRDRRAAACRVPSPRGRTGR